MTKRMKLAGGFAVAAAIVAGLSVFNPAWATRLGTVVYTTLTATTGAITTLTGATYAATGAISTTGASLSVSSGTLAGTVAFNNVGAYSTGQVATLSGIQGKVIFLTTSPPSVCVGTGTVASAGAYVYMSTSATSALRVCGS